MPRLVGCLIAILSTFSPALLSAASIGGAAHRPQQPKSGQAVKVDYAVTVAEPADKPVGVHLEWQAVPPGEYIRRTDPAYEKNWERIEMKPAAGGAKPAREMVYRAEIPGDRVKHRWLYRYRVTVKTIAGKQIVLPDPKSTSPNFAWFCYDGVPAWSGSREPDKPPVRKFSAEFLNTIKPYHLIARGDDIATSQWDGGAHKKRFPGTFVYDGVVYDHIAFTNRGQGSAYISGKNKWALKFNKEQPVPLTDNRGRKYAKPWNGVDLNPGQCTPYIPVHRGIAGLDEATTFRAYQLAGVPSSSTHWVHFRVIDAAEESPAKDQYGGDLWGLYLAIADLDQEILDEQKLPDGLIVSIQSGVKHVPADLSAGQKEWDQFIGTARSNPPEKWWRENLNLQAYYSFHALNRLMGNVDIRPDGNHGYYRGPDGKWSPLPWDNDMCFVPRHHQPGYIDAIRCLDQAAIKREYQNRAREILDLFAADASPTGGQVGQLVNELAQVLSPPGFDTNWAQLDEAMWNWHPRANQKGSYFVNPAYGDHFGGRWERKLATSDIRGFEKYLVEFCTDSRKEKNYQPNDGNPQGYGWGYVSVEALDKEIPPRPVIKRDMSGTDLRRYQITQPKVADTQLQVEWRVGQVGAIGPVRLKVKPRLSYEIEEYWRTSPEKMTSDVTTTLTPTSSSRGEPIGYELATSTPLAGRDIGANPWWKFLESSARRDGLATWTGPTTGSGGFFGALGRSSLFSPYSSERSERWLANFGGHRPLPPAIRYADVTQSFRPRNQELVHVERKLQHSTRATGSRIAWWAAATIFVSAFLLFQVQPIISKTILPWFGGSPAVWTTCVLFFQLVLLAGYAYAHALIRYVPPSRQGLIHGVLLALAIITLPITPGEWWKPKDGSLPAARILLLLAAEVGLPYFLLSSSGPLLQAWFSRVYPGTSPYRLYALSNVGSLLALLTYPVVFEPTLGVTTQGLMWSGVFIGFALLAGGLGWQVSRLFRTAAAPGDEKIILAEDAEEKATSGGNVFAWIMLPALASMLLLATTNHLCQDIAVVPFMWIVPLSLYLISFILCFDSEIWYQRKLWGPLGVLGVMTLCVLVKGDEWGNYPQPAKAETAWQSFKDVPARILHHTSVYTVRWGDQFEDNLAFQAAIYIALLFIICMLCHGELVKLKPRPQQLTLYYLMISAGGALGGLFVALICPLIFKLQFELALGIVFGYVVAWVALANDGRGKWLENRQFLQWGAAFAIMGGVIFVIGCTYEPIAEHTVAIMRNFYGTLTVKQHRVDDENGDPQGRIEAYRLVHGGILHGYQFADPLRRLEATTYYVNESGAGVAVNEFPRRKDAEGKPQGMRVAVVGLGAGTMAAHAKPGDTYRFYEIDPKVITISDRFFTFRKDAEERGAKTEVVLGDARIQMEQEKDQNYDVIVLDAFSGDAIPAHLLTVQSLELYKRHLRKDEKGNIQGILAVHISNKHLDLKPVVAALARRNKLSAIVVSAAESPYEPSAFTGSDRVLLTQNDHFLTLDIVANSSLPLTVAADDEVEWTDQHSSLLPILSSDWVKKVRTWWKGKPKAASKSVER